MLPIIHELIFAVLILYERLKNKYRHLHFAGSNMLSWLSHGMAWQRHASICFAEVNYIQYHDRHVVQEKNFFDKCALFLFLSNSICHSTSDDNRLSWCCCEVCAFCLANRKSFASWAFIWTCSWSDGHWSTEECAIKEIRENSDDLYVVCECKILSTHAVLMEAGEVSFNFEILTGTDWNTKFIWPKLSVIWAFKFFG